jgi:hypothetical protein
MLILLGLLEFALACIPAYPETRELKVEIVQGLGGDCYYKRIPPSKQPEDIWEQDSYWQTEFYTSANVERPTFTKNYYFTETIICLQDLEGSKIISQVKENDYASIDSNSWREFLLNDKVIASYAPIDIIESETNTLSIDWACLEPSTLYIGRSAFAFDEKIDSYVYRIQTLDSHIFLFDLFTGDVIPSEQPIERLFMDAVMNNDMEMVTGLLARGVDPNQGNLIDGAPIHLAVKTNNLDLVRMLLNVGVEADVRTTSISSIRIEHNPVYVAAENGNLKMIEILWGFGGNINQRGSWNGDSFEYFDDTLTPLEVAVRNGHLEIVRYLLEHGAEFSDRTLELAKASANPELLELVSSYAPR